jgi:hypothetical protein
LVVVSQWQKVNQLCLLVIVAFLLVILIICNGEREVLIFQLKDQRKARVNHMNRSKTTINDVSKVLKNY